MGFEIQWMFIAKLFSWFFSSGYLAVADLMILSFAIEITLSYATEE